VPRANTNATPPVSMRVPLTYRQSEAARRAIKAGALIRRLQSFALNEMVMATNGNGRGRGKLVPVDMSAEQVRAAFGLLAKVLPDVNRVELAGGEDIGKNAAAIDATQRIVDMFDNTMSPVQASMEYQRLMHEAAPLEQAKLPAPPLEGELV